MGEDRNNSPAIEGGGEEAGDSGETVAENGETSSDGRDTLEDLTRGRPHLIKLLDRHLDVVEKQPGTWLFEEGEKVTRCCYIVLGKVDIIAAGEVVLTVGSQELLGADELLLHEEHPTYTKAARAAEPTSLVWLDEDALIDIMGHGTLKGFLRLQARVAKQTAAALRRTRGELDKSDTIRSRLSVALEETQNALTAKEQLSPFPPRPSRVAPPPPPRKSGPSMEDLQARLRNARENGQALVRLIERSDKELKEMLASFRLILEKNPELRKIKMVGDFLTRLEAAVTRRENVVITTKPDP